VPRPWWLPALLALGPVLLAGDGENRGALSYSAAGVVNAASNAPGPLAPYAIASLYGAGLAYSKRAVTEKDIRGNQLPTELDGVRVLVDGLAAPLYYVSPEQINFLIPYVTGARFPTQVKLWVTLDGRRGPEIELPLHETAPALFQLDATTPIVTAVRKPEGSDEQRVVVISKDEPPDPERSSPSGPRVSAALNRPSPGRSFRGSRRVSPTGSVSSSCSTAIRRRPRTYFTSA
jgi:hypothetical protein